MIPNALLGPLTGRLALRLMAAFGLALMPLAFLSYNQAQSFETESQARRESALFGETLLAAMTQIDAISRARGAAAMLAIAIVPETDDPAKCTNLVQRLVKSEPDFSFAGFIPPDGNMTCSSAGTAFNLAGDQELADLVANPRPLMRVNKHGKISGESVLVFVHPVLAQNGALQGFAAISIPHRVLQRRETLDREDGEHNVEPLALITFDGEGNVLTAAKGLETVDDRLPVHRRLTELVDITATTFRDTIKSGENRSFAVMAIVPGSLYVLGSWPASFGTNPSFVSALPLWVFPLAMWLASLLVAYLAAENQILRHIRSLRRSILAFAGGSRSVYPPDLSAAPNELRDVGRAYERMMGSVLRDEATMEDSMRQKEVLLREVHHRVKNNLQLIASIMNLQIRKSVNPEVRSLLKNLHERVMSLATVHRELYQTSGLTDVQADELLESIVAQVLRMATTPDRVIETRTVFDPIRLTPDQAVPLSLILTEALTNALKHGGRTKSGKTSLSVSLRRTGTDYGRLEVSNSMKSGWQPSSDGVDSTGLGHQLLTAFASQLLGTLSVGTVEDTYRLRLDFPLRETTLPDADPDLQISDHNDAV